MPTQTEAWKAIAKFVIPNIQDPDFTEFVIPNIQDPNFIDELSENLILVARETICTPTAQCRQCRDPSGVETSCGNTLVGEVTLKLHVAQSTLIQSTEQFAVILSEASVPFDQGFQFAHFHRTNSQYYTCPAMRLENRLDI